MGRRLSQNRVGGKRGRRHGRGHGHGCGHDARIYNKVVHLILWDYFSHVARTRTRTRMWS